MPIRAVRCVAYCQHTEGDASRIMQEAMVAKQTDLSGSFARLVVCLHHVALAN